MNQSWQTVAWIVVALCAGALAWFAIGNGPGRGRTMQELDAAWALPSTGASPLAAADKIWEERHPWGALAPAATPDVAPREVPAIPVGTAVADGKLLAVFMAADGSLARLAPGDAIAGGGRLDAVSQFHVSWTDARGTKHEQELLADPLPMQVSSP